MTCLQDGCSSLALEQGEILQRLLVEGLLALGSLGLRSCLQAGRGKSGGQVKVNRACRHSAVGKSLHLAAKICKSRLQAGNGAAMVRLRCRHLALSANLVSFAA